MGGDRMVGSWSDMNGIFKRRTTGLKSTVEGESSFSYRM